MDVRLIWIGIAVGAAMIVVALIAATVRSRGTSTKDMTPDQWIALGTVFTGAGVALVASTGPAMFGMVALGIIYLGMGLRKKREQGEID